jgi:hypothetical protein
LHVAHLGDWATAPPTSSGRTSCRGLHRTISLTVGRISSAGRPRLTGSTFRAYGGICGTICGSPPTPGQLGMASTMAIEELLTSTYPSHCGRSIGS